MLRMFDGFGHWQPGGIGITLPAIDGATSVISDTGSSLNHFWTGKGGTVATSTGELVLSGTDPYLFITLDNQASWTVGVRFKQSSLFSGWGAGLIRIRDCSVFYDLVTLSVESSGKLSLYAGNQDVLLATTAAAVIASSTYYYVELQVVTSVDGLGNPIWSMAVQLGGKEVPELSISGTGTLPALVPDAYGAANMNQILLAGTRTFDNFYALDGQVATGLSAPGTDFLGPCTVEHWAPGTDSEAGGMTYAAGSPTNTGTYGFTAWGVNSTPGSVGTGTAGNALAAVVKTQYAVGDSSYIGTALATSGGNKDLVMAGFAPLAALSSGHVYGVSSFAVCKGSGSTTLNVGFGAHISKPTTPFYGSESDATYATSDTGWNLIYIRSLSGGYGRITAANGDGHPWDDTVLGGTQWHINQVTGSPGSIKVTQFGLLVLRTAATTWPVAAASSYVMSPLHTPTSGDGSTYEYTVTALAIVEQHYFPVAAYNDIIYTARMQLDLLESLEGTGYATYEFTPVATASRSIPVSAATEQIWTPNAAGGRDIQVSASTGYGMRPSQEGHNPHVYLNAFDTYQFSSVASSLVTGPHSASTYLMAVGTWASLFSPSDEVIPGTADIAAGPQIVLYSGLSHEFPLCFVEASNGTVLMANGIDPMLRWDGFSSSAERAGVDAPGSEVTAYGLGNGLLVGKRYAIQRFIDRHGNISNPGPISDPFFLGQSGSVIGAVVAEDGVTTLFSRYHGLASGDIVTVGGLVGVAANGTFAIVAVDRDHFTLVGIVVSAGSVLQNAGYWIKGVAQVNYIAPVPTDPKVVRRQILRTLDGNATVFYVDVDTSDVSGTEFSSTLDDQVLSGQEAVPFVFDDQMPAMNRYGVPPSHKSVLAYHLGRVFAAVDVPYSQGSVEVQLGSSIVHGVGVSWPDSFVGRLLIVDGASRSYVIKEVRLGQFLILDQPYADQADPFALYVIRPSDVERRLCYYSGPNVPEAWAPWDAFSVPEHSDELTGLLVMGSFLYLVEQRHINSFAFKSDPGRDGFTFLRSHRGCVNNRCMAVVEDVAYMLDEAGIHRFNGENSEHVSSRVHNLFNDPTYPYRVDWGADRTLWHSCVDPVNEVIRWFLDLQDQERLTHALCYDYRRDRFWLERYPEPVSASAVASLGSRRVLAGTTARRVICLDQGTLDGISPDVGTVSGSIFEATSFSVSISSASSQSLAENLQGLPLTITSGPAKGQVSVISASDEFTIEVVKPFPIQPQAGDTFQVGGIPWAWEGHFLPMVDEEQSNSRDLTVLFKPTAGPGGFDMRAFYDYADAPKVWGVTRALDGVSTVAGSPDIAIDTQQTRGYAIQHIAGRRASGQVTTEYFTKVGLQGVQGVETTRIFQIVVNGAFWEGGGTEAIDRRQR